MTDQELAVQMAVRELQEPTWGITQQYMKVHRLRMTEGQPEIARVDDTREPGSYFIYFRLEDESYYLVSIVDTKEGGLELRGFHMEADVSVCFEILSDSLTPEDITLRLGLQPSRVWHKGAPKRLQNKQGRFLPMKGVYNCHGWFYEPQWDVPDEIERKLSLLLDHLEPVSQAIATLATENNVQIGIGYHGYSSEMWGWHLDSRTIQRLAGLGADVDLDIYAKGPDLP